MSNDLQTGKTFDMRGYDLLAQVQHVTDDMTMLFVLHNNSTHVLLAEATAPPVRDMDGGRYHGGDEEPAMLVASFAYAPFEHGWRVAYKQALAAAMRRAHSGDPMCDGCGCMPGDGVTAGCTHPDGCGYDPDQQHAGEGDAGRGARQTTGEHLRTLAANPDPRD